jgi:hypothetical protein
MEERIVKQQQQELLLQKVNEQEATAEYYEYAEVMLRIIQQIKAMEKPNDVRDIESIVKFPPKIGLVKRYECLKNLEYEMSHKSVEGLLRAKIQNALNKGEFGVGADNRICYDDAGTRYNRIILDELIDNEMSYIIDIATVNREYMEAQKLKNSRRTNILSKEDEDF